MAGTDCKYCGAYIASGLDHCPACGKKIRFTGGAAVQEAPEEETGSSIYQRGETDENTGTYGSYSARTEEQEAKTEPNQAYTYKNEYQRRYGTQDGGRKAEETQAEVVTEKAAPSHALSYLSYLGILVLIPWLSHSEDRFTRYHANQGLVLLLMRLAVRLVGKILPIFGWAVRLVGGLFGLYCILAGLVHVHDKEEKPLPIIGEIQLLK